MGISMSFVGWENCFSSIYTKSTVRLLGSPVSPTSEHYQLHEQSVCKFHMGGRAEKHKYHLIKLSGISIPKSLGGWGLLSLRIFGRALLCKSLWRAIQGDGL